MALPPRRPEPPHHTEPVRPPIPPRRDNPPHQDEPRREEEPRRQVAGNPIMPLAEAAPGDTVVQNPDPPVKTIAEEQRERSAIYEEMGNAAYAEQAAQVSEPRRQVAGVGPLEGREEDRQPRRVDHGR